MPVQDRILIPHAFLLVPEMIVPTGQCNCSAVSPFESTSVARFFDRSNRCGSRRIREYRGNIGRLPRRGKEQLEVFSALQRQGKRLLAEAPRDGGCCLVDWNPILSDCCRDPAFAA